MSKSELDRMVRNLSPLRLDLGSDGGSDRRWVELFDPRAPELLPGRGVRIICAGHGEYTMAGVPFPFRIAEARLLFSVEQVATRTGPRFQFRITVEDGDLRYLPGTVDQRVIDRINAQLGCMSLEWDLAKAVAGSYPFADVFTSLNRFDTYAEEASLEIEPDHIHLSVRWRGVVRRATHSAERREAVGTTPYPEAEISPC